MCTECKRIYCPDACPGNRDSGYDSGSCCICGDAVLSGEEHFRGYGVTICGSCADTVGADELIELCSLKNTAEMLGILGFQHCLG